MAYRSLAEQKSARAELTSSNQLQLFCDSVMLYFALYIKRAALQNLTEIETNRKHTQRHKIIKKIK